MQVVQALTCASKILKHLVMDFHGYDHYNHIEVPHEFVECLPKTLETLNMIGNMSFPIVVDNYTRD